MKAHKSELSALYDGELEAHESQSIVAAAVRESELLTEWQAYALIGDALRQEDVGHADLTASVMAQLGAEPVVLAPRKLSTGMRSHPLLALAASVAGVAVVGWLALAGNAQRTPGASLFSAVSPAPTFVRLPAVATAKSPVVIQAPLEVATVSIPEDRGEMSEFMLAHHLQASTFRLPDSTEHIRTVTLANPASRP